MTLHPHIGFLQNINGPEILIIFLIVLLLFGAKRLPELFRSFGKSIKEFKKATSDIEDEVRSAMDVDENGTSSQQSSSGREAQSHNSPNTGESPEEPSDGAEDAGEKRNKPSGGNT